MTQDMKKDTILHTITKLLVRNWRTPVRSAAYSSALTSALRVFVVLFMLLVGIIGVNATDYYYFIVNKSGKIVTYARVIDPTSTNVDASSIPLDIKSVNAKDWKFYNGDQLNFTGTITLPTTNKVIDCSLWGDVALIDNPLPMTDLSECGSSTKYPNYIFVFCDYDENSVPDLRNETYYTMQYRGNANGKQTYAYYDVTNFLVANSGTADVNNAQNHLKYLWCFKAAVVNGEVDPYDVKVYNALLGTGNSDHFVAAPGLGTGPEYDGTDQKDSSDNTLRPLSKKNNPTITTYYFAPSYQSGDFNITGNPVRNVNNNNTNVDVYYNLWAEYQLDGQTPSNIGKSGITNNTRMLRNGNRKQWSSIILTAYKQTYKVVDGSGNIIVQASTTGNSLEIPDVIKSPLATYTYYSDAECTNEITSSPGPAATIYVRYTTNDVLDLSGGTPYNIKVNGNYLYDNSSVLALESSEDNIGNSSYTWTLNGNDAYQITIQNVANTSNKISYDVSSGEAAPTLGAGSNFFLRTLTDGKYEIVATTTADFTTSGYYTLGVANSTLKLYSKSNYPMGENEVQAIIQRPTASLSAAPTANSLTYNKTEQELVSADGIVVKNGTLQYRLGDSGDYSDNIPKATDANTYSVYYKVKGNTDIEDFIAADPVEVTINKKSISVDGITASNKVYDGNTIATLVYTDATLAGNLDGENLTVSATGTFENVNVGTGKNVSISELTLGGSAVGNYVLAESGQQETTTANITAAEITVSGITAVDKPYDGNTTATLVYTGVTLTGNLDGENLTVTATGAFADASVGNNKNVAISDLTLGGSAAGNYALAASGQQTETTANITKAVITVSGITARDKVYDGGTSATLDYSNVTLSGKVGSEDLSITATGTFDNKNVGTGKSVTISGLTLGGTAAGNYVLAESEQQETATADITAKEITVSGITANNKPYDGTTTATLDCSGASFADKVGEDNLTVTATGVFADASVGNNKNVAISDLTLGGSAAGNYALAASGQQTEATANITKAEITVSGIEAENKEYDGGNSATLVYSNVTLAGKVGNEDLTVSATGAFADANVETGKTVSISGLTLGGSAVGNYVLATSGQQETTTANITAAEITVSGITASNKTYDGNATATLVYTGATLTGNLDGENLSVTATGTFDNKNVGTGKTVTISDLTIGGTASGNYELASSGHQTETTADITKAALSVTAKNYSIAYGDNPANDGVTYTGFVNGETESVLGGTLAFSYNSAANGLGTPYASTSSPGSYFIIPSGLTSTNYNISFVAGTLTVGQKSLGSGDVPNTGISFSLENGNIIVKDGETTLSQGDDYTLGTPTTSGRYTTTEVTGIGNYASTLTIKFANVNLTNDGHQGTEWSATFVADGDHALPTAEGITPYIVESINLSNNTVSLTALDYIPNGVPVLLLSNSDAEGFLVKTPTPTSYTEISSEQIAANRLKVATGSESFALRQIYLLYNNEFVLNMPGSLDAGRVYMVNPSFPYSSPARLRISRAPSTGISEIDEDDNTDKFDDRWYNLDGLRLNGKPTKKGLYLKEGKKVVIK